VPRQNTKKALLTAFTKKFKTVSDEIKSAYYQKLNADLSAPIDLAKVASEEAAEKRIYDKRSAAFKDRAFQHVFNYGVSFTSIVTPGYILQYLRPFGELEIAVADVYEPVKIKYTEMCKAVNMSFVSALNTAKAEEALDVKKINEYVDTTIRTFVQDKTKTVQALQTDCVLKRNADILKEIHDSFILKAKKDILKVCRFCEVRGDMMAGVGTFRCLTSGTINNTIHVENYDLTKEPFQRLLSGIESLDGKLDNILTTHKKTLLFGKYFMKHTNGFYSSIIYVNPSIPFVQDSIIDATMCRRASGHMTEDKPVFMTAETYERVYYPIIATAKTKLIEKGIMTQDTIRKNVSPELKNIVHLVHLGCSDEVHTKSYGLNSADLLIHQVKKLYCKEIVKGAKFGEMVIITADSTT
jgi:hypothetical protein